MPALRLAMLNTMADPDIARSITRQAEWGVRDLDLKDGIFGKGIVDLSDGEAHQVAELAAKAGMRVHCLSTLLFYATVEELLQGKAAEHLARLPRLIAVARILKPRYIRLIAARAADVPAARHALAAGDARLDPLFTAYRQAIDTLADAGQAVTIENECRDCVLAHPDDVVAFFKRLDRRSRACFTWDVQNMWTMGYFPSLDGYRKMRTLIGYYHVKGGRAGTDGSTLKWRAPLAEATWPVAEISRAVIADDISPVICLNPSHGEHPTADYDHAGEVVRDLAFMNSLVKA